METKHKTFNPFDRVLVKDSEGMWQIDLYAYWNDTYKTHHTMSYGGGLDIRDEDIMPFEKYSHLLGTTDEPEEEVRLEEGEIIIAIEKDVVDTNFVEGEIGLLTKFKRLVHRREEYGGWGFGIPGGCRTYAIRFCDFNVEDMEETKKHILCVKNGKIVKYKG